MLSFVWERLCFPVHSVGYAMDAMISVSLCAFACLAACEYVFRVTRPNGLAKGDPQFDQVATTSLDRRQMVTYRARCSSTSDPNPEPESEPAWFHDDNCVLPLPEATSTVPEIEMVEKQSGKHREMSPPRVLRWSYDAHVEDEKKTQRKGTFSPLANSLRPELKFPPGLDIPSASGWDEISCGFAGLRSSAQASGKTMEMAGSRSLREDMERLKHQDPECVLVVKKIKKLGFESPTVLKEHFGQYGIVLDVMVALTHSPQKTKSTRVRPAAMGFVVMGDASAAKHALQAGVSQDISGVVIELRSFSSFNDHYGDVDNEP